MLDRWVDDYQTGEALGRVTMEAGDFLWVKPAFGPGHFVHKDDVWPTNDALAFREQALLFASRMAR